jgi:hypothetical protein
MGKLLLDRGSDEQRSGSRKMQSRPGSAGDHLVS